MHPCLNVSEILSTIFGNFYESRESTELAALARTCQAFNREFEILPLAISRLRD